MRHVAVVGIVVGLMCVASASAADRPERQRYRIEGTTIIFDQDAADADLAVLDQHPELIVVSIPGAMAWSGPDPGSVPLPITDAGFAHLARCTKLQKLYLSSMQPLRVTDDGLKSLAGLVHLKVFVAGATPFTDAGIIHLAPLVNMEELWLDFNTQLSDASMATIAKMTKLRVLRFHGAQKITDTGIAAIRDLSELEDLQLGYAYLTDAGMEAIGRFTNIKTLDLQYTQITDVGLTHLKNLKKLTWICFRGDRKITSAGLIHLADKTNLRWLILDGTVVDDDGMMHLANLTKLESVYLDDTHVTDKGLTQLLHFPMLKNLHLSGTSVTDEGIQPLATLTHLENIELNRSSVTSAGFARLATHLPNLKWTNRENH